MDEQQSPASSHDAHDEYREQSRPTTPSASLSKPASGHDHSTLSPLVLRLRPSLDISDGEDPDWKAENLVLEDNQSGESDASTTASPLKRPADNELVIRPFKRQKGLLNIDYLDLLNKEIEDAAQRVCVEEDDNLNPSQLGLTSWSGLEKNCFFDSVARMGRDDLEGIAARIGSKSIVEVRQYMEALDKEKELRQKTDRRLILEMAEYPAAVELSQPCCRALEEMADNISVRQEGREQQREEAKWGGAWDLTPEIARKLERGDIAVLEGHDLPSVQFFDLGQWLKLSQRVFMNSSIPSENWTYIDDAPPSIWATTMEDFYSLAVSITRRLVQTTIFAGMSRIRDRQEYRQGLVRSVIHRKDVEAAVESLGMVPSTKEFWRRSARRLRLSVYDDPQDDEEDAGAASATGPLTFEQVEDMLATFEPTIKAKENQRDTEPDVDALHGLESESSSDEEESLIHQEANEVLRFSAADIPETYRMRQALKNRIATEQQQERHADQCDEYASYQEELEMWDLLRREPPKELRKKSDSEPSRRSGLDVESIYRLGRNWRAHTERWGEWEMDCDMRQQ